MAAPRKNKFTLTQEVLKTLLYYNPESGSFIWLKRDWKPVFNARFAGKEAGNVCTRTGYKRVTILKRTYLLHRLVFLYMKGENPRYHVDHKNHDKLDNRWENLRDVPSIINDMNKPKLSTNTSGHTGVYKDKLRDKWYAQIRVKGHLKCLGSFDDFDSAVLARLKAEEFYGFHENHGK